jgi:hypothetical protein
MDFFALRAVIWCFRLISMSFKTLRMKFMPTKSFYRLSLEFQVFEADVALILRI